MRLIDADALLGYAWDADTRGGYVEVVDVGTIEEAPTIDPVKHGKWEEYKVPHTIRCSECGLIEGMDYADFKYCPNCGARMEGE
jgi:hypothetical protein